MIAIIVRIRAIWGFSRDTCKNGSQPGFYFHNMTHIFFIQLYSLLLAVECFLNQSYNRQNVLDVSSYMGLTSLDGAVPQIQKIILRN
ncbi:hypothetical protein MC28_E083 (plasmid) [Bacillus thuringiensis MC28]|nr:hypothetical protein MC28_E083 [Bacillus thuringiensis MC28]